MRGRRRARDERERDLDTRAKGGSEHVTISCTSVAARRGALLGDSFSCRRKKRVGKKGGKKIREKVLFARSNTETPIFPEAERSEASCGYFHGISCHAVE